LILDIVTVRMRDEIVNWKILRRAVQCLFVLCFRDRTLKSLKTENIVSLFVDMMIKAYEEK
jgi:hypothetical protein